jgi:hypothetical protein
VKALTVLALFMMKRSTDIALHGLLAGLNLPEMMETEPDSDRRDR